MVEYDGSKVINLTKVENEDEISPPPFLILYIEVQTFSGKINPEEPIGMIKLRYEDVSDPRQVVETLDNKEEKDILETFCSYVQEKDPDIFVFEGDHYANTILDYLFARIVRLGLELDIGRDKRMRIALLASLKQPGRHWIRGRLAIMIRLLVGTHQY